MSVELTGYFLCFYSTCLGNLSQYIWEINLSFILSFHLTLGGSEE